MFSKALLILSLTSVAFSTVFVINPTASSTFNGGGSATVAWKDDGNLPTLESFGPSSISIYVGNQNQQTLLQLITDNTDVSKSSSIDYTVNATIGPDSNKYFIRFQSIKGVNGSTPYQSFSAQFTLANMKGTFSPAIEAQIAGQSTAPLGGSPTSSASSASGPTSTPSLTSSASARASSTSSSTNTTSSAMGVKAGWAGVVVGAVVGVTLF